MSQTPLDLGDIVAYVEAHIGTFHDNRLSKLDASPALTCAVSQEPIHSL
jgi:hypothetical protein